MNKISISLLLVLVALVISCQTPSKMPPGWRSPSVSELGDRPSSQWRDRNTSKYLQASGDFDGDGKTDYAQLLVRQDRTSYGVFVLLSSLPADTMLLACVRDGGLITEIGIRRVPPGKYATAAGKGYGNPDPSEPLEVTLMCDAIDLFAAESANSYLIWDSRLKTFNEVWISD